MQIRTRSRLVRLEEITATRDLVAELFERLERVRGSPLRGFDAAVSIGFLALGVVFSHPGNVP